MSAEMSAVRTVNRISDILNCFSLDEPVLSLAAISSRLGLPRSTTHRLLTALEQQGYLSRAPSGRGYQLGYQLLRWGLLAHEALDLRNEALPVLERLSKNTGETAILSVRDGTEGICVEKVDSSHPVRLTMHSGQRLPLHAGASAKILWAFLPEGEIRGIMARINLTPLERNTITSPDQLYQELALIRRIGYATSFEETDSGAMGVSAPVCDHKGQVIAGIGIAAPLSRVPPERVPELSVHVLAASRQLSHRLGARTMTDNLPAPEMVVPR